MTFPPDRSAAPFADASRVFRAPVVDDDAPVPAPEPRACVALCVTAPQPPGWSVYAAGTLRFYGHAQVDDHTTLDHAVQVALDLAREVSLPAVMVLERSGTGASGWSSTDAAWGAAWRDAKQAPARVLHVSAPTWQRTALPHARDVGAIVDAGRAALRAAGGSDDDAAQLDDGPARAILIGTWATRADEVQRVLQPDRSRPSREFNRTDRRPWRDEEDGNSHAGNHHQHHASQRTAGRAHRRRRREALATT